MKKIWVTFRKKGIHKFPGASEPRFEDVSYLAYPHRHLWHFKVAITVFHNDREIEFHQFLNWLESLYDSGVIQLDYKSCEMLADELAVQIQKKYPNRHLTIDISEDGECGVECHYIPSIVKHVVDKKDYNSISSDSEWLQLSADLT